jgi:hypothetical protein
MHYIFERKGQHYMLRSILNEIVQYLKTRSDRHSHESHGNLTESHMGWSHGSQGKPLAERSENVWFTFY